MEIWSKIIIIKFKTVNISKVITQQKWQRPLVVPSCPQTLQLELVALPILVFMTSQATGAYNYSRTPVTWTPKENEKQFELLGSI